MPLTYYMVRGENKSEVAEYIYKNFQSFVIYTLSIPTTLQTQLSYNFTVAKKGSWFTVPNAHIPIYKAAARTSSRVPPGNFTAYHSIEGRLIPQPPLTSKMCFRLGIG